MATPRAFKRQASRAGDVLLALSTSSRLPNILDIRGSKTLTAMHQRTIAEPTYFICLRDPRLERWFLD
jgi:hypothetical protein